MTVSAAAGPGPGQPTAARGSAAQPLRPRADSDSADGGASDSALSRSAPGRPGSDAGPRRGPPDSESEG